MTEPASAGQHHPRAFLRVAGASVAQHQIGLALALDCQRVVCLARKPYAELIALQVSAEDAGLQFHVAHASHQISGLVTARDELVVIAEGLFADSVLAATLLEDSAQVVTVLPADVAVPQGFERIDISRAFGGVLKISAQFVEKLHDFPDDIDVPSALMRMAVQSGLPTCDVPAPSIEQSGWQMIRDESDAHVVEIAWLKSRLKEDAPRSLSSRIAAAAVGGLGATLLHAGNASNAMSFAVAMVLVMAAVLGWFGAFVLAFVCVAISAVLIEATRMLRALERQSTGQLPPAIPRADVLAWGRDVMLGGLALAAEPIHAGQSWIDWGYAPVMLMLLSWLVPRLLSVRLSALLADRTLLSLILSLAALAGHVPAVVELMGLGMVLCCLFMKHRSRD